MNRFIKNSLLSLLVVFQPSFSMLMTGKNRINFNKSNVQKIPLPLHSDFFENKKLLDPILSDYELKQAAKLMENYPDVKYGVFVALADDNTVLADAFKDKSVKDFMMKFADAQELSMRYPITFGNRNLEAYHFMVLTKQEAQSLSNVMQSKYFTQVDIDTFIEGYLKLKVVDQQLKCSKALAQSIKLYPSFGQRIHWFFNEITPKSIRNISALELLITGSGVIFHYMGECYRWQAKLYWKALESVRHNIKISTLMFLYGEHKNYAQIANRSFSIAGKLFSLEYLFFFLYGLIVYKKYRDSFYTNLANNQSLQNILDEKAKVFQQH